MRVFCTNCECAKDECKCPVPHFVTVETRIWHMEGRYRMEGGKLVRIPTETDKKFYSCTFCGSRKVIETVSSNDGIIDLYWNADLTIQPQTSQIENVERCGQPRCAECSLELSDQEIELLFGEIWE